MAHPPRAEALREYYRLASDDDLLHLVEQGQTRFAETAWGLLQGEIARRWRTESAVAAIQAAVPTSTLERQSPLSCVWILVLWFRRAWILIYRRIVPAPQASAEGISGDSWRARFSDEARSLEGGDREPRLRLTDYDEREFERPYGISLTSKARSSGGVSSPPASFQLRDHPGFALPDSEGNSNGPRRVGPLVGALLLLGCFTGGAVGTYVVMRYLENADSPATAREPPPAPEFAGLDNTIRVAIPSSPTPRPQDAPAKPEASEWGKIAQPATPSSPASIPKVVSAPASYYNGGRYFRYSNGAWFMAERRAGPWHAVAAERVPQAVARQRRR